MVCKFLLKREKQKVIFNRICGMKRLVHLRELLRQNGQNKINKTETILYYIEVNTSSVNTRGQNNMILTKRVAFNFIVYKANRTPNIENKGREDRFQHAVVKNTASVQSRWRRNFPRSRARNLAVCQAEAIKHK